MKELFKNKNYSLLFIGSLVSEMGNVIFGFVAGLYVQDLAEQSGGSLLGIKSGIILALFIALGAIIRVILTPFAAVLVDRWDKVKIIWLTDYLRGIMFVVVAYVFFVGVSNNAAMLILLAVAAISGIVSAFFGPAISSVTPEIVSLEKVQVAQGANSIIQSSTMILGVILGAAAFGLFEFHIALMINGISFLLSGFSEMFIKALYRDQVITTITEAKESVIDGFKVGLTYLKTKQGLLTIMVYSLFLNFAFSPLFSLGVPYLFRTELSRSEWDLAWVNIAFGIAMMVFGILVGGLAIKSTKRFLRKNLFILSVSFLLSTLFIYLLSVDVISYQVFYVLLILSQTMMAGGMMATNIPLNTALIKMIDEEYRARVFGVISSISGGAVPIAITLGGILMSYTSVAFLGIVCAVLMLVPTIGFLTNHKVSRLLDDIDDRAQQVLELVPE